MVNIYNLGYSVTSGLIKKKNIGTFRTGHNGPNNNHMHWICLSHTTVLLWNGEHTVEHAFQDWPMYHELRNTGQLM